MTTTIAPTQSVVVQPAYRAAGFADVLRSEWTKARTVRSTFWTLLAAAVLGIGLGALISALAGNHYSTSSLSTRQTWDPTAISGAGMGIAQLAIGILGVMLITSEYSTRAIASTLAAVPRRGRLLSAKAVVMLAMAFIAVEVITVIAFFIGQALMSGHAPTATLGDPGVLRALIGAGLYGALLGLLGLALGTILRHAAGAIAVLVAILFVLPGIAAALPTSIENAVQEYWPTQAGSQVTSVVRTAHTLAPWAGFGVFALFVAILSAIAWSTLNKRDA
jgi:ABC-type transport system involved in multi-copper enzyme maturation permease subunit